MARPPSIRRLLVEDFPADQRTWIGKLLQVLNQFMDETGFALSKNVSLRENTYVQIKELEFIGNATILGTISSGSPNMTNVSSTVSLTNGMLLTGDGIPLNTTISSIAGNTITMSANATSTSVGVLVVVGDHFPITFKYELSTRPVAVLLANISENVDNPSILTNAITIDWEYDGNNIIINHISGLKANQNYFASFLVYGE